MRQTAGFSTYRRTRIEIIAEPSNRLSQSDPDAAASISALPRIVAFRNRLIHAYDAVDDATVWGVVESHYPAC